MIQTRLTKRELAALAAIALVGASVSTACIAVFPASPLRVAHAVMFALNWTFAACCLAAAVRR